MDTTYLPFVVFGQEDISSKAPRIVLDMKASRTGPELSVTLPYYLDFTIRRPSGGNSDPCIFRWSAYSDAFAQAQVVLLHVTEHGRERVEVEPLQFAKPELDNIQVNGWNQFLWELPAGEVIKMREKLTANYQQQLVPGERYELLWPGAEVAMWDWGSVNDHVGQELKCRDAGQMELPRLIVPTTSVVAFTAKQESVPWPDRPETENEADFQQANIKEDAWRREQDIRRNPPLSPFPRKGSGRV